MTPATDSDSKTQIPTSLMLGALALGILPAFWGGIDNGDSVRYLTMARALASGDRGGVINGLWSPLYPILHGLALRLFHPSWRQELRVVSSVDFIIYFFSIVCFRFFWGQVFVLSRKLCDESASVATSIMLPERSFWILGYSIFLYSHLPLIGAGTPDLLLAAIVNLAAGILLQIRFNTGSSPRWPAFGGILGIGYLTKAVLFPLSFVFLACAIFAGRLDRRKIANGLVACGMLVIISAPFIWAISNKEGHLTIGDSGRLNYAWHVNRTPGLNWQGLPAGFGVPLHPTTRILEIPEAYEFPGKPNEIFPPFDNPSYWNEGLKPRFVFFSQLRSWKTNSLECLKSVWPQGSVFVLVFITLGMLSGMHDVVKRYARTWYVWVPALASTLLYLTIHWEERYFDPFMALAWAPLVCAVRLPTSEANRHKLKILVAVVVTVLLVRTGVVTIRETVHHHRMKEQNLEIAAGLYASGLKPHDKIAEVDGYVAIWEWLARVRVVAEISAQYPKVLLPTSRGNKAQIYERLSATGAKAIISSSIPEWGSESDWQRIRNTPVYVHYLEK